jgi:glycosyltransferase involved in cell wall biosynthesis
MNTFKISTVIPTFNREFYLKKAIQSCLDQTLKHEIIVCNHGGTDGTDKMVEEFKGKIRYIKKITDHGPHYCWLEGIMEASGDYINLVFDDDWLEPKYLEKCMKYFINNEEVGFVFSAANVFDDKTQKILFNANNNFLYKDGIYDVAKYESFFLRRLISPTALIIRKKDIIDALYVGNLPLSKASYKGVGPDRLMVMLCILRYSKFGYSSEALVNYRSHPNSITMDSLTNENKKKQIKQAYLDVNRYYFTLKFEKYALFFYNKFFINIKHVISELRNFITEIFRRN